MSSPAGRELGVACGELRVTAVRGSPPAQRVRGGCPPTGNPLPPLLPRVALPWRRRNAPSAGGDGTAPGESANSEVCTFAATLSGNIGICHCAVTKSTVIRILTKRAGAGGNKPQRLINPLL